MPYCEDCICSSFPNCIASVFTFSLWSFFRTHFLSLSLHVPVTLSLCKIHIPLDLLSLWKPVAECYSSSHQVTDSPLSYYQIAQRCQLFYTTIFVIHKHFRHNSCRASCFAVFHHSFQISSLLISSHFTGSLYIFTGCGIIPCVLIQHTIQDINIGKETRKYVKNFCMAQFKQETILYTNNSCTNIVALKNQILC